MPNPTQIRHIKINVDTKGNQEIKALSASMAQLNRSTKGLQNSFSTLNGIVGGFLGASFLGLGIQQLVAFSDEMQNLNNRITVLTGSAENARVAMGGILRVANETNQSIDSTAEVYARLGASLQDTGIKSDVLLSTVKALTNTFRLSGSTTNETTATIIQLSQAFSSGQLRGQELRSVMLQNTYVAQLLRKEFGRDIYKKAEDGAISAAAVFKVLFADMDNINKKAKELTPTISQSLSKALNSLKVTLLDLNQRFDIAGKFAAFVDIMIQKMELLGVAIGVLTLTVLPALGRAFISFAATNPVLLAVVGLSIAIVALNKDMNDLNANTSKTALGFTVMNKAIVDANLYVAQLLASIPILGRRFEPLEEILQRQSETMEKYINGITTKLNKLENTAGSSAGDAAGDILNQVKTKLEQDEFLEKITKLYAGKDKLQKIKEILGELNREFLKGTINAQEYGEKLTSFEIYKLNREFSEGKFNLEQYNEKLADLKIKNFRIELAQGIISFDEFNKAVQEVNVQKLNDEFSAGKITLDQYYQSLAKISQEFSAGGALRAGAAGYIESIGTITNQTAQVIQSTFKNLEDSLLDFIKRGKFNFAQFTQAILDDLARIIIRASIVQPLAQGLLNFSSGSSANTPASNANYSNVAAKGAWFDGDMARFANGGIVNSPTPFSYSKGRTGLMGEAGPEAILPLSRGEGGKLGVQATVTPVTVNIINQTEGNVETRERTGPDGAKMIEVLITNTVRDGIATGKFDKAMGAAYGSRRRGS